MADAHRPIHVLAYGDAGSGKSTFAATFPKPALVFSFDPLGKETPYLKRGTASDLMDWDYGRYREVVSNKTGNVIVRIEYYQNADVKSPQAYPRFLDRTSMFDPEQEGWATVAYDSLTFMEIAARKWAQYVVEPGAKEPRRWHGIATDQLEEQVMVKAAGWNVNVVVIAHIDEQMDDFNGMMSRSPKAPGRLRKGLPAGFGEVYRAYVIRGKEGNQHVLQTRADAMWVSSTQVNAPNPAPASYQALWTGGA